MKKTLFITVGILYAINAVTKSYFGTIFINYIFVEVLIF